MGATIMVVEDEPNIGALVRTYLTREGYSVIWVRSGEDALTELGRHPVRLVVLDIGLPGLDGFEVCRRIAGAVPVIMLTARDEEPDRVAGLEVGADDYVSKPFSPRELTARVKAVLRRAGQMPGSDSPSLPDVSQLGSVTLARAAREVRVDGREVELTQREFCSSTCCGTPGRSSPATGCSRPSGASALPGRHGPSRSTWPSCARSSTGPT
jgi:two-component system, OmpR family, response regulator ResD